MDLRSTSQIRQKGMTLVISMIMLIMITMATIASFQLSRTGLDIAGNMQFINEATESANSVIQEVISSTAMFTTPGNIFSGCNGANTRCFDFNNDGTNDVSVALTPQPFCIQSQPIPNSKLNLNRADDRICATGVAQVFGVKGAITGTSLCSTNTWQVRAVATDPITGVNVAVSQGISVRASTANFAAVCPN